MGFLFGMLDSAVLVHHGYMLLLLDSSDSSLGLVLLKTKLPIKPTASFVMKSNALFVKEPISCFESISSPVVS